MTWIESQRKRIREELPRLSRRMRTAFAAACAERVLPVVEDYFDRQNDCRQAIDLAWRFACDENVPESELTKAFEACEALVDQLYDDDQTGSTLYAVKAISSAIESTLKPGAEVPRRAATEATDAAYTDDSDQGDNHIQEEAQWQILALDTARAASTVKRDMFKHLPAPPRWLESFYRERAARPPIS